MPEQKMVESICLVERSAFKAAILDIHKIIVSLLILILDLDATSISSKWTYLFFFFNRVKMNCS